MENKRIEIEKLVDEYNKRSSEKLQDDYLKSKIKVIDYVDYSMKNFIAEKIINGSCFSNGIVNINSCNKYMLYIYALLKYWTNLDIKEDRLVFYYDLLNKNNMIEKILAIIPEKEITEFSTILEMKQDDLLLNECNTSILLNKNIKNYLPRFMAAIEILLSSIGEVIGQVDVSKMKNIIKVKEK